MNDDGDFDVLSQALSAAVKTVSEQRDLSVDTVVTAMLSGAAKVLAFRIDVMPDKREEYTATACGLLRTAIDYQVTVLRNER
jgi:hypothetical protein